eukprot:COSAG01_NODE_62050_length_286_cov_1.112299_1_plen_95_part_11
MSARYTSVLCAELLKPALSLDERAIHVRVQLATAYRTAWTAWHRAVGAVVATAQRQVMTLIIISVTHRRSVVLRSLAEVRPVPYCSLYVSLIWPS